MTESKTTTATAARCGDGLELPAKRCCTCGEQKSQDQFHRSKASLDGLCSRCKPCAVRVAGEWRKANRPRFNAGQRKRRAANPFKYRMYAKSAYRRKMSADPDLVRAKKREKYRRESKWARLKRIEYQRKYMEKRKDFFRAYRSKWRTSNPDRTLSYYVRSHDASGTILKPSDFPRAYVEARILTIKLKRHLWQNRKTSTNSVTNSSTPSKT